MLELQFFLPPQIGPFSFQCLLQAFNHFKIVLFVDIVARR
jgi:hypothetical protein